MRQFMHKENKPFGPVKMDSGNYLYVMVREDDGKWYALFENGDTRDYGKFDSYISSWKELKFEEFWTTKKEPVFEQGQIGSMFKKCDCEMSSLLRYGCKCGGI